MLEKVINAQDLKLLQLSVGAVKNGSQINRPMGLPAGAQGPGSTRASAGKNADSPKILAIFINHID